MRQNIKLLNKCFKDTFEIHLKNTSHKLLNEIHKLIYFCFEQIKLLKKDTTI